MRAIVGDKVRCLKTYISVFSGKTEFTKDKIYEVREGNSKDTSRIEVVADDTGIPNGWDSKYFELIRGVTINNQSLVHQFKVGDKVKDSYGGVGVVVDFSDTGWPIVQNGLGIAYITRPSELTLVNTAAGIDPNDIQVEWDIQKDKSHRCYCSMETIWREGCRCKGV